MNSKEINEDIFWVGVDDRETQSFESMWPIQRVGITYNAYAIKDEKIALIDPVRINLSDLYLSKVKNIIGDVPVDYIIINHMEPDHTGAITEVVKAYPNVKIVCNKKTVPMLDAFYEITENLLIVNEGDTLNLGKHTLQFYTTPMVHWPESMVTFEVTTKTLFSMDIFGSYKVTENKIFDDENNLDDFYDEIYRYYATIIGKVSKPAQKALKKLAPLEIKMICPAHGLIWRDNLQYILKLYEDMSHFVRQEGVVIVYGSMYGNTKAAAEQIKKALEDKHIENIKVYNVSTDDISYIVRDIWKYKGLILGAPSYYGRIFPKMAHLLYKLEEIRTENHKVAFFTNYSWSGGAAKYFDAFAKNVNSDVINDTIRIKGRATKEDEQALIDLANKMASEIKS